MPADRPISVNVETAGRRNMYGDYVPGHDASYSGVGNQARP